MKIAVHGLGRMGMQIARKLSENGHEVIAHNRSLEPIKEAAGYGAVAAQLKSDVINAFNNQPLVLWIMLPADIIDEHLSEWLTLIPRGSTIVDGGNSDYRLTRQRAQKVQAAGSVLIDSGTSGGVWGYQNGFSLMIGGDAAAAEQLQPVFETLAAPGGAFRHFGPSGAGHFVKMTHNAIEYGMMESLAEGYRMLKEGPYPDIDLAAAGDVWQHNSVVRSWLNELTQAALAENPELAGIDGFVAESGEARWALETANELHMPMPAIQAAFDVRIASRDGERNFSTKLLAAMRNKFGGHDINKNH
jgi:6-phosphogluconate dehydrogenase